MAREFLAQCAEGREVCCLAWSTVMSYLRIATHPAIFATPLTPDEAMQNIEALLRLPHVLYSRDRDLQRFDFLDVRDPLAGGGGR